MSHSCTAHVKVTGEGRNGGRARSDDGLLDTDLALPKELGGTGTATNPEQLFAVSTESVAHPGFMLTQRLVQYPHRLGFVAWSC